MPVAFTRFPDLVKKEILDLMNCYDLFSFSETSKRSRSLSQRSAKLHKGNMEMMFGVLTEASLRFPYLKLTYSSTSHSTHELPTSLYLKFKDSKFEHLEKYLSVCHSSLFVNMTISMVFYCAPPFETAFLTLEHLAQLGYAMEECDIQSAPDNEAIVRTLMILKKAKNLYLNCEPTEDFKDSFDFKTPFTGSLENEKLLILSSKWVSAWHVINVFNMCCEITLFDSYFEESEVIKILKSWRIGSSIKYLRLAFVPAGSNEDFGAKMLEINAKPVPEAVNEDPNIPIPPVRSSWLLQQENTNVQVLISIEQPQHNREKMFFTMKKETKLLLEDNIPV
ncbi:Protein CBG01963 [Caenorhabditis briggsae]|uniref:Protein CBG01963 n=1 Tax=Caenorhabditis briggsae TaxID=6238 RepID=A8WRP5_CAEBR|nr:Protein CBG01963 [Caenorhabditis briggsae]CAP23153.1 Protein CBG01963 [Caenorhabditis briggsae]